MGIKGLNLGLIPLDIWSAEIYRDQYMFVRRHKIYFFLSLHQTLHLRRPMMLHGRQGYVYTMNMEIFNILLAVTIFTNEMFIKINSL